MSSTQNFAVCGDETCSNGYATFCETFFGFFQGSDEARIIGGHFSQRRGVVNNGNRK